MTVRGVTEGTHSGRTVAPTSTPGVFGVPTAIRATRTAAGGDVGDRHCSGRSEASGITGTTAEDERGVESANAICSVAHRSVSFGTTVTAPGFAARAVKPSSGADVRAGPTLAILPPALGAAAILGARADASADEDDGGTPTSVSSRPAGVPSATGANASCGRGRNGAVDAGPTDVIREGLGVTLAIPRSCKLWQEF